MGTFGMNTGEVNARGLSITKQAEEFGFNHKKINEIIDAMIASDYTSDDAIAIAEKCKSYDPLLNQIQAKIEGHGTYGINASRATVDLNEQIKSQIAKNL